MWTPTVYVTDHDMTRLTSGETIHKTLATLVRLPSPEAPKVRMTVCPNCSGCGEHGPEDADCPQCDGTGQVEAPGDE